MFCPGCGNNLADGAKFCPSCGTSIGGGRPAGGGSFNIKECFDFRKKSNKMNYIAFGSALFLFLTMILDMFIYGDEGIKIWELGGLSVICGLIVYTSFVIAILFSILKKDAYILVAGLSCVLACILMIIVFNTGDCADAKDAVDLIEKEYASYGSYGAKIDIPDVGVGVFGYICMWLGSLSLTFAGVARKFIKALD